MKYQIGNRRLFCPCWKARDIGGQFQLLARFKKLELNVYRHVAKNEFTAINADKPDNTNETYIIECAKNIHLTKSEFYRELGCNLTSCPRCRRIVERAKQLLKNVEISNEVKTLGVCTKCLLQRKRFCQCHEIVRQFNDWKKIQNQDTQYLKQWFSQIDAVLNDIRNRNSLPKIRSLSSLRPNIEGDEQGVAREHNLLTRGSFLELLLNTEHMRSRFVDVQPLHESQGVLLKPSIESIDNLNTTLIYSRQRDMEHIGRVHKVSFNDITKTSIHRTIDPRFSDDSRTTFRTKKERENRSERPKISAYGTDLDSKKLDMESKQIKSANDIEISQSTDMHLDKESGFHYTKIIPADANQYTKLMSEKESLLLRTIKINVQGEKKDLKSVIDIKPPTTGDMQHSTQNLIFTDIPKSETSIKIKHHSSFDSVTTVTSKLSKGALLKDNFKYFFPKKKVKGKHTKPYDENLYASTTANLIKETFDKIKAAKKQGLPTQQDQKAVNDKGEFGSNVKKNVEPKKVEEGQILKFQEEKEALVKIKQKEEDVTDVEKDLTARTLTGKMTYKKSLNKPDKKGSSAKNKEKGELIEQDTYLKTLSEKREIKEPLHGQGQKQRSDKNKQRKDKPTAEQEDQTKTKRQQKPINKQRIMDKKNKLESEQNNPYYGVKQNAKGKNEPKIDKPQRKEDNVKNPQVNTDEQKSKQLKSEIKKDKVNVENIKIMDDIKEQKDKKQKQRIKGSPKSAEMLKKVPEISKKDKQKKENMKSFSGQHVQEEKKKNKTKSNDLEQQSKAEKPKHSKQLQEKQEEIRQTNEDAIKIKQQNKDINKKKQEKDAEAGNIKEMTHSKSRKEKRDEKNEIGRQDYEKSKLELGDQKQKAAMWEQKRIGSQHTPTAKSQKDLENEKALYLEVQKAKEMKQKQQLKDKTQKEKYDDGVRKHKKDKPKEQVFMTDQNKEQTVLDKILSSGQIVTEVKRNKDLERDKLLKAKEMKRLNQKDIGKIMLDKQELGRGTIQNQQRRFEKDIEKQQPPSANFEENNLEISDEDKAKAREKANTEKEARDKARTEADAIFMDALAQYKAIAEIDKKQRADESERIKNENEVMFDQPRREKEKNKESGLAVPLTNIKVQGPPSVDFLRQLVKIRQENELIPKDTQLEHLVEKAFRLHLTNKSKVADQTFQMPEGSDTDYGILNCVRKPQQARNFIIGNKIETLRSLQVFQRDMFDKTKNLELQLLDSNTNSKEKITRTPSDNESLRNFKYVVKIYKDGLADLITQKEFMKFAKGDGGFITKSAKTVESLPEYILSNLSSRSKKPQNVSKFTVPSCQDAFVIPLNKVNVQTAPDNLIIEIIKLTNLNITKKPLPGEDPESYSQKNYIYDLDGHSKPGSSLPRVKPRAKKIIIGTLVTNYTSSKIDVKLEDPWPIKKYEFESVSRKPVSTGPLRGFIKEEKTTPKSKQVDAELVKGVIHYSLSDREYIDKGWTLLPTEKVVRKMNVYRMRPARPEFDWFERNKHKKMTFYDSGERLAEIDDDGRGRWYYRSGRLAMDYYNAEEINSQQRIVIYSSGEADEKGRSRPVTVLAMFDYIGNGVVFDHSGKIRLKYNQTEGVVLDRNIGPVSNWKWHSLNDPPVLQQVMIDTQLAHKDPNILKLGPQYNQPPADNEDMLAIEFDNFIKEKSKKLAQSFKPYQIKMKALKINDYFSLRVLDQATIYLLYRDGTTNLKLNIGMVLDHQEIIDTDTAELGDVPNSLERFPARTDSLEHLQKSVAHAQRVERMLLERDRRLRPPASVCSADRLVQAASRPLQPTVATVECDCHTVFRKTSCPNIYYNNRIM